MMPSLYAPLVVVGIFSVATFTDIRSRRVPRWLTFGGMLLGVAVAALGGWNVLLSSLVGLAVGGALLLPFVVKGGVGAADALLLAAGGAWLGWQPILHVALWGALAGGVLALFALARGRRSLPYAPAFLVGALLALAVR